MTLMILGNGASRLKHKDLIRRHDDEVWGCNRVFLEHEEIPSLTLVGSAHTFIGAEAISYRETHGLDYEVVSSRREERCDGATPFLEHDPCPEHFQNINTGMRLIQHAAFKGHRSLLLVGIDIGGPCVGGNVYKEAGALIQLGNIMRYYGHVAMGFIK